MASISPSAWASPPSTSMSAHSSSTSPKSALVLPLKQPKGRRLSAVTVRASLTKATEGTTPDEEPTVPDRVKLALERAKAYQKEKSSTLASDGNPGGGSVPSVGGSGSSLGAPDSMKIALERAKEYRSGQGAAAELIGVPEVSDSGVDPAAPEAVTLGMERGRRYEENKGGVEEPSRASEGSGNLSRAVPDSMKLAMERARESEKNKGAMGGNADVAQKEPNNTGLEKMKVGNPESMVVDNQVQKAGELKVSSLDFLGLNFSEKKNRGVPAGLVPVVDNFSDEDLPEVEIIVGDASKFGSSAPFKLNSNEVDENEDLYKPKVSTWGVFPRPSDISKTFGGGRNIRAGEVLENAEVKAAKEERTKQLIASYKSQIGLTIDAKMKAECEKALKDGDRLMDIGKLREAIPYYEKIMKKLAFQVKGLNRLVSDHIPLLLSTGEERYKQTIFRYELACHKQDDFKELVAKWWTEAPRTDRATSSFCMKLRWIRGRIKKWVNQCHGQTNKKEQDLIQLIEHLEMKSEQVVISIEEESKLRELTRKYNECLLQEEIKWKRRAKEFWLKEGITIWHFFMGWLVPGEELPRLNRLELKIQ